MPLFWFDTDDGYSCIEDDEGCEVSDMQAAQKLALETVVEIASTRLHSSEYRRCAALVRDAAGRAIYRTQVEVTGESIHDAGRSSHDTV